MSFSFQETIFPRFPPGIWPAALSLLFSSAMPCMTRSKRHDGQSKFIWQDFLGTTSACIQMQGATPSGDLIMATVACMVSSSCPLPCLTGRNRPTAGNGPQGFRSSKRSWSDYPIPDLVDFRRYHCSDNRHPQPGGLPPPRSSPPGCLIRR